MSAGVVLITGIAGGLGLACAEHLRGLGYDVLGWDAAHPEMDDMWHQVDVSNPDEVDEAVAGLPPLIAVVNCAGVSNRLSVSDLSVTEFDSILRTNTVGTYAVARSTFPALAAGGGTFVAIGSVAGSLAFRNRVAYCTSKAAVRMLVSCLAIEWAADNVRAVCISPGFVDAGMSAQGQQQGSTSSAVVLSHTPNGRLVRADEVAATVAFVISPGAGSISGSEVLVDGAFAALSGF
jgi:NAD(P)-dependent dehydrogenase (short-subunit alcohol dehydrogenase family)